MVHPQAMHLLEPQVLNYLSWRFCFVLFFLLIFVTWVALYLLTFLRLRFCATDPAPTRPFRFCFPGIIANLILFNRYGRSLKWWVRRWFILPGASLTYQGMPIASRFEWWVFGYLFWVKNIDFSFLVKLWSCWPNFSPFGFKPLSKTTVSLFQTTKQNLISLSELMSFAKSFFTCALNPMQTCLTKWKILTVL